MARLNKRQRTELLVELAKPYLQIQDWNIVVQFARIPGHRADCEANPEYKDALVRFDIDRISNEDLTSFVVHELLHTIIWKLAHVAETFTDDDAKLEWVRMEEESLTTHLERIIVPLIEDQLEASIKLQLTKKSKR